MLLSGIPLFRVMSEVQHCLQVRRFRFPVSHPDDVSSRPDTHLSTIPFVRKTCHTVRTPDIPSIICLDDVHSRPDLHCFEKLLFQLAFVRTFQQPIWTPLSDRAASDSFQVQFKGRLLQPTGRRGFPSGRAHT
jgi:hypothetical protein